MSLLLPYILGEEPNCLYYQTGNDLIKASSAPSNAMVLKGRLYASRSGWLLLSVPNALVRGIFDAMHEPGIELPPGSGDKPFNAHISVMREEEVASLGGVDKITERGHDFTYQLGPLKTVIPMGWDDMSRVWFVHIDSPELKALRKSYGLPALPQKNGKELNFHLTVAVKRRGILLPNEKSKVAAPLLPGTPAYKKYPLPAENEENEAEEAVEQMDEAMDLVKNAASVIPKLRQAKAESDRRNYAVKHQILMQLMRDAPDDWMVDSASPTTPGITHVPTGFRFHLPRKIVPTTLKTGMDDEYLTALKSTPLHYDTQRSALVNVGSHLRAVQNAGNKLIAKRDSHEDYKSELDPNYRLNRMLRSATAKKKPGSGIGPLFNGFPFKSLGDFYGTSTKGPQMGAGAR